MDFLFDIGNVIVGVDFIPALTRLVPGDARDVDERLRKLLERKDEFEAGRVSPDEYFPWAARTLGFAGSMNDFMEAWIDIFSPNEPMWSCIRQLRGQGHRLILFSNINDPHKRHLLENYPVFQHFTGGVFSYQTGHIKPEPEIYDIAVRQYRLTPGNTAYVDDLPANVGAGRRAGFLCHQYNMQEHGKFMEWLGNLL